MSVNKLHRFLVVLITLRSFHRADATVCILKESCILPCSFKQGDDILIHWLLTPGPISIHSYYNKKDQLERQDQRFTGRTSLFHDQISKGNASLRLTGVKLEDRGRYKCYTSTTSGNKESFINLDLEAPPRKVEIQQVGNRITCSSERIYPKPALTWSSTPPNNLIVTDPTIVLQKEKLYSINSSLIALNVTNLDYSCTISNGRKQRSTTLSKPAFINISNTETTISCNQNNTNTSQTDFTWRFNHSVVILTQTTANVSFTVPVEWRKYVKNASQSGSLILTGLTSDQTGIYTCEFNTAEETYVTNTFLIVLKDSSVNVAVIAGSVVGACLFLAIVFFLLWFCFGNNGFQRRYQNVRLYLENLH